MHLKSIRHTDVKGKRVLVRVDFNVELNIDGDVTERYKLDVARETVDYLVSHGASKIALATHLGRPAYKGEERFSVRSIVDDAERALGRRVRFAEDCIGEAVERALEEVGPGELLLLENTRFYPEEEANSETFAEQLAKPFDLFVNEAFSACHRAHASVVGVTKFLPAFAGFRLCEEVERLEKVKSDPERPAVAVIGGAKIETKLPLIRAFEKNYDAILVGGRIANEALDEGMAFSQAVHLPEDFNGKERFDIGPRTAAHFADVIGRAKTIVWNGPMGKFEEEPYDRATKVVLQAMLENRQAFSVVGGGESLTALEQAGAMDKVGFVSTGGGAMLEFLADEPMPGVEVLRG
jgi:phosphoglycerate kinase